MFGNSTFNITGFGGNGTNSSKFSFGSMFGGNNGVRFAYIFTPGTYNMTVTYLPSRNFNETSNDKAKLTILPEKDVVFSADIITPEKYGDKTVVNITVNDGYGKPISNATVSVTLGDIKTNVTVDGNGTGAVSFDNLVNGNYTLMLAFNGTNQTFEFEVYASMQTVINAKDMSTSTINVNVDGNVGDYFIVTLKDELGDVLVNKSIEFAFDGKKIITVSDDKGVAKLQINVAKAGEYTIAACFLGDELYGASFAVNKITVTKQTPKLTTNNAKYKAKAKAKKLKATFKSSSGKALKGKKITFNVKGKTYVAKTNAKGVATVKIKLNKKGTYKFTAKFEGDDTYKAVSKKAKLILK